MCSEIGFDNVTLRIAGFLYVKNTLHKNLAVGVRYKANFQTIFIQNIYPISISHFYLHDITRQFIPNPNIVEILDI